MSGGPHGSVDEAMRVADAFEMTADPETRAFLAGWVARVNPPMAGKLGEASAKARAEWERTAAHALEHTIDEVWLPVLVSHFGEAMEMPGLQRPSALDTASAIGVFARLATSRDGRPRLRDRLAVASGCVRRKVETCVEVITQALAYDGDAPDLSALSMELLRLEAVRMIAEGLADDGVAREFAYISRRLARVALNRASDTMDAFLADRAMERFFDNAAVVGRVDDILVIALRVLDAKLAGEEEGTAFVQPADQQALTRFLESLARLTEVLTDMVFKMTSPKVGTTFFHSLLLQLACVARFCQRLEHQGRPDQLDLIFARLRGRLGRLAQRLGDALEWSDPAGPDRMALTTRVAELAGALMEMGLVDESRALIARLG